MSTQIHRTLFRTCRTLFLGGHFVKVSWVPIVLPTVNIVKKSYFSHHASCGYVKKWNKHFNLIQVNFYSTNENWTNLSYEDLKALINSGDVQLIDVREPKEIEEQGSLPNSINISLGEVEAALCLSPFKFKSRYGYDISDNKNANLVFSCFKGVRSYQAMMTARGLGFDKARHFGGGWEEWSRKSQSGT